MPLIGGLAMTETKLTRRDLAALAGAAQPLSLSPAP
jgi:hypothetical protein